jgi:hypothetical protein
MIPHRRSCHDVQPLSLVMAMSEHNLSKLTADQVHAHERFAWMEITVEELQGVCRGAIEFDFGQTERKFSGTSYYQSRESSLPSNTSRMRSTGSG